MRAPTNFFRSPARRQLLRPEPNPPPAAATRRVVPQPLNRVTPAPGTHSLRPPRQSQHPGRSQHQPFSPVRPAHSSNDVSTRQATRRAPLPESTSVQSVASTNTPFPPFNPLRPHSLALVPNPHAPTRSVSGDTFAQQTRSMNNLNQSGVLPGAGSSFPHHSANTLVQNAAHHPSAATGGTSPRQRSGSSSMNASQTSLRDIVRNSRYKSIFREERSFLRQHRHQRIRNSPSPEPNPHSNNRTHNF